MKVWHTLVVACCGLALAQPARETLLPHWDYDQLAPLELKEEKVQDSGGVQVHQISYAAPVGDRAPLVGPNAGLVTASLVVPAGPGPFPAVIYGHWCMPGSDRKNRTEFLEEALVLAHSGVLSLLPDHVIIHPGFVEDKAPLNQQQIAVEVQQDINLRRGADLLLKRKDVDSKRLAYVGHSCDAAAGAYLSGIDKRFKAFVLMAGDLSTAVDRKTKAFEEYRQKIGAEKFDAFLAKYSWMDAGQYVSHAAPAAVFLQYASEEPFLTPDRARQYLAVVSEPKKLKIYSAPHALNSEATRDRIAFLSDQLSFKSPGSEALGRIPALVQPPWPKEP
ncbi:MAG: hypothetical protein JOZ14_11680 [Acidobacteria bacterium]|nr:hypothetical protein [Acidobacteriota bacterium]